MGCKLWLSLAQARGAGHGQEDAGCCARWWLEEGREDAVSVVEHSCVFPVTPRADSPKTEGPGIWQCCFLKDSPSSPEVLTSSLPDCTQHLPWRGTVNSDSAGGREKKQRY